MIEHVRSRRALLVLDNCEHILMACAYLAETILRACPHIRVLATSREAFGTLSAVTWRVPALNQTDAIALFADRARQLQPDFALTPDNTPTIATICARLDGMPLAIELAATRVRALSVAQIAARLADQLKLLIGARATAVPRQQTLRATIDWSYALLSDDERSFLRRLSVFVGGWTLEAAEALFDPDRSFVRSGAAAHADSIPSLDLLTSLVDKSLVVVEEHASAAILSRADTPTICLSGTRAPAALRTAGRTERRAAPGRSGMPSRFARPTRWPPRARAARAR